MAKLQNKPKQAERRPDGTLLPGSTANPGGRPKGHARLIRELLDLGPDALKNLKEALAAKERWATELVVNAFTIKELIAAVLMEKSEDGDDFNWDALPDSDIAKVISIVRKAKPAK